jgi:hypothetical protein
MIVAREGGAEPRLVSVTSSVRRICDVRFTPKSGHGSASSRCPLCAKADIHERSVGESLVSNSFEMKIYIRDCRNTLSLYLTCRIQYNSRNFSCIRHPPDNKPV